jgi:hypothetical protein
LFVQTVTFGGVAAGLVFTMTGPPHLRRRPESVVEAKVPSADASPPFWQLVLKVIAWQLAAALIGAFIFGPVVLLQGGFARWIDVPGCRSNCRTRGLQFESFYTSKTAYGCRCLGTDGAYTFHDHAFLTGGHSARAAVVDGVFRVGTSMLVAIGWPLAVVTVFAKVRRRQKDGLARQLERMIERRFRRTSRPSRRSPVASLR